LPGTTGTTGDTVILSERSANCKLSTLQTAEASMPNRSLTVKEQINLAIADKERQECVAKR
jgi:hypothetical protein